MRSSLKTLALALTLFAVVALPAWALKYNLSSPEYRILTSWLYESPGYLDLRSERAGETAREALAADPALDVVQWFRDNDNGDSPRWTFLGGDADWWADETPMVWWIRSKDNVDVPEADVPSESLIWIVILEGWDDSINAGFARQSQQARNQTSVPITDENGDPDGTIPAGSHLAHQQNIITKAVNVLSQ